MRTAESLFQAIYNRAPDDNDRRRLLAAQKAMGLSDNDEMWPVIITLDHYSCQIMANGNRNVKTLDEHFKRMQREIDELVDVVRERAALKVATELSEESRKKILEMAEGIYEEGRKRHLWDRVLLVTAGVFVLIVIMWAFMYYILDDYFSEKEQLLIAEHSRQLANIGLTRNGADFATRFSDITDDPDFIDIAEHYRLYPVFMQNYRTLSATDPYLLLPPEKKENIRKIIIEAEAWDEFRKTNNAPWPCMKLYERSSYRIANKNAKFCGVGYNN